jgi:predicted aconitase with swiveling domain
MEISVRRLVDGDAEGEIVKLETPLSFWGGFDVASGRVIERSHPSYGEILTGRILVMPSGRGSSSASSILAEAIREGTAPNGIIMAESDPILTVGAIVAKRLYERSIPIVVCDPLSFSQIPKSGKGRIIARPGDSPRVQLVSYP